MSFRSNINSSNGDVQPKVSVASKTSSDPKSTFSKASYKLGQIGDDLARRLHESRYLYALYGALDGPSNSCSNLRYIFDLIYFNSDDVSDDKLHEFLSSPQGMVFVGIETLFIMAYATIGNYYLSKDKNSPFIRFLVTTWPYLRDCFKGSKNAFKGIKATLNISSFLSGVSFLPYVVPASIGFGALAVINRLLMRYMYNQRKQMMKKNKQVWLDIQALNASQLKIKQLEQQGQAILDDIQEQSNTVRTLALVGAAFGGVIDGLYMYVGVVMIFGIPGLLSLTAPVALFLISCSILYGLINIAVRLHDEYNYQKKIDISVAKANLALTGKKIECLYHQLCQDQQEQVSKEYFEKLTAYIDIFYKQREELRQLSTLSYKSALLLGISHGLAAYGALASLLFAVSTITFLFMHALPPVLLMAAAITIASGLVLMAAFAANAVYQTYRHRQQLSISNKDKTDSSLKELKCLITLKRNERPDNDIEARVNDCMVVDSQPLFFYMELFEIVRSFFSGVGKGPKSVLTTFNALEEKKEDGYYHIDNWFLLAFTTVSSCVYAICLALRAYARGFGRKPVDHIEPANQDDNEKGINSPMPEPVPISTSKNKVVKDQSRTKHRHSNLSMFTGKPITNRKKPRRWNSDSKLMDKQLKPTQETLVIPLN